MFRVIAVIALASLAGAASQIVLRKGMQIVGPLESYALLDLLRYFGRVMLQPYVIGGTALSGISYACILAALSWTGVTVAFPLTALEYGFAAILAVAILREAVPPMRWAGIAFVIVGVILVSASGEGGEPNEPDHELAEVEGTHLEDQ